MTDLLNILIHSNTLNFFILVCILCFLLYKLNINSYIENITSDIKCFVDDSVSEKEKSEKALEEIQAKIQNLPREIDKINLSAELSVKNIAEKFKAETESKKLDIKNNADRLMNLEIKNFNSKLSNILSEKSVDLARQNAISQLNNNLVLHNIYIEKAIDDIDRIIL